MSHTSQFSKKLLITFFSLLSIIGYGAFVFAVAPPPSPGGYTAGTVLDPGCSPGQSIANGDPYDCFVAVSGGGTPSGSNGYIQYNSSGSFGADSLFTRDPLTKDTNIFRDASVNIQTDEYVVNAYPILLVQVFGPGSFTVGETITGQNSGATAVVEGYILGGSGGFLYVSNILGTFIEFEQITSTFPGTVIVDEEILPSSFAVGDAFVEFDYPSGPTGVTGSVTAVSGDSITVNVTGGSLTPSNILFNTTQNNNYRGIVSAQPVTVSGTAHTGFTLSNIAIGTPFSGSGMYSELNGNKLFAGIVNGYQFGIFSEISGTPSGYYLPTTAGTTGQALISLGGNTVGWGTLPSAISVNNDGTLYSGTLGAGEGDRDNIFLGQYAGQNATNASYSNFFGTQAGEDATNASNSNFLGNYAGQNATNASHSNFLGNFAGQNATNASNSNFLGNSAGYGATDAYYSNFLGSYAGQYATGASQSNFFGQQAGQNATNAYQSNFLGYYAGYSATGAYGSNFLGSYAGQGATNASNSNFLGYYAGINATSASNSNFLGQNAGASATNASKSNFLGSYAGNGATNASYSNFFGQNAGASATNASNSNFFGQNAGASATNASNSNFLGNGAGNGAASANNSNFLGLSAGHSATGASYSNFLGQSAGFGATNAYQSNFLGLNAGVGATGASYSNFLGLNAGQYATGASNSIFIGKSAGNNDLVNNTGSLNDFSILIGPNTSTGNNGSGVGYSNSIALGGYATNTASNQFMIGSAIRPINDIIANGTGSLFLPIGNDLQRTAYATDGAIRYNTDQACLEMYSSSAWACLGGGSSGPFSVVNGASIFSTGLVDTGLSSNAVNSFFVGDNAGNGATNANNSNFFGYNAGINATNAYNSNFLGLNAGNGATGASFSNFLGQFAGILATGASYSNFLGQNAGKSAAGASNSNFLGYYAGYNASNAYNSNFLGSSAGYGAIGASNSIFIGRSAGHNDPVNNTGSPDDFSILIGSNTSTGNNGSGVGYSNSIALGGYATNTASNQFMIGSSTRPINQIVMVASGGTTCATDINGTACSSDERLKTNITDLTTGILDKVVNTKTVTFNWNNNTDTTSHIGFIAQDIQQYFPELVSTGSTGYLSVNYAGMTPVLVQAIREMDLKITTINDMATPNTWRDSLIAWFGNVENGITDFFAKRVTTDELCVGTVCVTQDQFLQMVQQSGQVPVIVTSPQTEPDPQPTETTPDTTPSGESDQSDESVVTPPDTSAPADEPVADTPDTSTENSPTDAPSDTSSDAGATL